MTSPNASTPLSGSTGVLTGVEDPSSSPAGDEVVLGDGDCGLVPSSPSPDSLVGVAIPSLVSVLDVAIDVGVCVEFDVAGVVVTVLVVGVAVVVCVPCEGAPDPD
jgi:hypothetical protein